MFYLIAGKFRLYGEYIRRYFFIPRIAKDIEKNKREYGEGVYLMKNGGTRYEIGFLGRSSYK